MNPHLPPAAETDRLVWLKRLNASLSQWAATLSWGRMAALALIAMVAGSWIGEKLQLTHDKLPEIKAQRLPKASKDTASTESERACEGDEIRIGGKNGIVICEGRRVARPPAPSAPPAPPAPPAPTLPQTSTPTPAPVASAGDAAVTPSAEPAVASRPGASGPAASRPSASVRTSVGDDDGDSDANESATLQKRVIRKTLAGWVGDLISVLLIALFAYLVAAKIIFRKSAEADAKLRVATDSAEREAMQRQLVTARLKLLQAQVEPHFLFNTLAAVDYLIETDPARASVMQKTLISYLRAALPQMRQASSTLGRELKLIRAYLELLKLRIEERLEFDIKVTPELESAEFPPMVLQTLVENAIKHGIEPKPQGGRVSVLAELIDGQLRVDVVDTGVGLPNGDIFENTASGAGLGLDNIRNRLALLYPGTSRMELRPGRDGGTLVRLTIPYQREEQRTATASNDKL